VPLLTNRGSALFFFFSFGQWGGYSHPASCLRYWTPNFSMSLRYERAIKRQIEKSYAFSWTYDCKRSLSITKSLRK